MTTPPASVSQQYRDLLEQGQAGWARCADCGRAHFYPRQYCPHCLSGNVAVEPAAVPFRVRTFTRVYRPQRPAVGKLPVLIIAGEAEGTTIIAEGSGWGERQCQIGVPARLVISGDERNLPVFAPAAEADATEADAAEADAAKADAAKADAAE
jgi:uncharacterized protein